MISYDIILLFGRLHCCTNSFHVPYIVGTNLKQDVIRKVENRFRGKSKQAKYWTERSMTFIWNKIFFFSIYFFLWHFLSTGQNFKRIFCDHSLVNSIQDQPIRCIYLLRTAVGVVDNTLLISFLFNSSLNVSKNSARPHLQHSKAPNQTLNFL